MFATWTQLRAPNRWHLLSWPHLQYFKPLLVKIILHCLLGIDRYGLITFKSTLNKPDLRRPFQKTKKWYLHQLQPTSNSASTADAERGNINSFHTHTQKGKITGSPRMKHVAREIHSNNSGLNLRYFGLTMCDLLRGYRRFGSARCLYLLHSICVQVSPNVHGDINHVITTPSSKFIQSNAGCTVKSMIKHLTFTVQINLHVFKQRANGADRSRTTHCRPRY
jgi:hypothetical protein